MELLLLFSLQRNTHKNSEIRTERERDLFLGSEDEEQGLNSGGLLLMMRIFDQC